MNLKKGFRVKRAITNTQLIVRKAEEGPKVSPLPSRLSVDSDHSKAGSRSPNCTKEKTRSGLMQGWRRPGAKSVQSKRMAVNSESGRGRHTGNDLPKTLDTGLGKRLGE